MVAMTIRRQISMAEVVLSVCALIVSEAILDGESLHPSDSNRILHISIGVNDNIVTDLKAF